MRSAAYNNRVLGAESQASIGATGPCVRLNWRRPLAGANVSLFAGRAWMSAERTALRTALDPLPTFGRE